MQYFLEEEPRGTEWLRAGKDKTLKIEYLQLDNSVKIFSFPFLTLLFGFLVSWFCLLLFIWLSIYMIHKFHMSNMTLTLQRSFLAFGRTFKQLLWTERSAPLFFSCIINSILSFEANEKSWYFGLVSHKKKSCYLANVTNTIWILV